MKCEKFDKTEKGCIVKEWKLQNFSVSQILCEIKVRESRDSDCAFSTHVEALNLAFYEFLHCLQAEIYQINQSQISSNGKKGYFKTSRFSKIDFT